MARFKLDVAEFCASCSIHGLGKAAKASATKWHKFGWLVVTLIRLNWTSCSVKKCPHVLNRFQLRVCDLHAAEDVCQLGQRALGD